VANCTLYSIATAFENDISINRKNDPFLRINLCELHHTVIQRLSKQDIFEIMLWRRSLAATYTTHSLAVAEKGCCQQIMVIFYMNVLMSDGCNATKIPFMYSSSGNCVEPVPISKFMCLGAIYILYSKDWFTYFLQQKRHIDRSQTHEYGNWERSPVVSFL
jgi:hypothetical protein